MVSTCPLISKSSRLFINLLGIVPSTPITIAITVIFRSFSSLVRSWYLYHVLLSFILFCFLPWQQSPLFGGFSLFVLTITIPVHQVEILLYVFIAKLLLLLLLLFDFQIYLCFLTLLHRVFTLDEERISLEGRVFANGPGDPCSILCRVIPKTFKMVLDTSLLNTQQYKVRVRGKVEQSWEKSSVLPYTSL